ncbi:MAG: ATP phosphoribosyltransferase [Bacteroidaceae bacterium]|nr:ATP phosphoribosyltransferase [Bacteroidaceae bacterium]
MLRIAVQSKGRLHDDTMSLLRESDIKVSESKRTLLVRARNFPIETLFLRDDDIPATVANGVADVGIVGLNELEEKGANAEIIRHLGFGACRLSLALPKDETYNDPTWFEGKTIATSYPAILRRWLKSQGINATIHVISGSVEISTGVGLADAIFDIVSSGSTLVTNNLREVETIMHSDAVLIANKQLDAEKRAVLEEMLFRFDAIKNAETKKYVLLNAPQNKVEAITALLPGVKSPTVMPLAESGWCSIHTVIDEERFWEIIGKLKAEGAQGILVMDIEKIIV